MGTREKVTAAMQPLLKPGEKVEVATVGTFGKVSVKRQMATALLTTVASGGMLSVYSTPKKVPMAMTSDRLVILGVDFFDRPKSEIVGEVPREGVRARKAKSMLWLAFELTDTEGTAFARISFPIPARGDGTAIAAAFGPAPEPAAKS